MEIKFIYKGDIMHKSAKKLSTPLFLASLGKTRLRPGGKEASDRIIQQCQITKDTKVLEVATNMGTTAIYLAQTFGCYVTGIDLDIQSLERAKQNVLDAKLENKVTLIHGNALDLPFENNSFDVVINEAMLSILSNEQRKIALSEYYRVLKPGGRLGTQDMLYKNTDINQIPIHPFSLEAWLSAFQSIPFSDFRYDTGKLTLLSLKGLIVDEGWDTMMKIFHNAMQDEDAKEYLFELIKHYDDNQDYYGHITFCAQK